MIAGGHHINAQVEKLFRQRRRDSEPSRCIFAVGNDQVWSVLQAQFRQTILYDGPPRTAENVADKQNLQRIRSQVLGPRSQEQRRSRSYENVLASMLSR